MSKRKHEAPELPVHLIERDAERFIVGTVLRGGWDEYREVKRELVDEDLTGIEERKVWELAVACAESGEEPSIASVMRLALSRKIELTFATVLNIEGYGIPGVSLEKWLTGLRRAAINREAYRVGELIRLYTADGLSTNGEAITAAQERLRRLEQSIASDKRDAGTITGAIEDCGGLDKLFAQPVGVIEPPWFTLRDAMNGGFAPGTVTVIGARPSVGKSSFALQSAITAAGDSRRTVFFSLEMQKPEIIKRLLSMRSGIDYSRLVRGVLNEEERAEVRRTIALMESWPLEIYCDLFDLRTIAAKVGSTNPAYEFAVLDYLGLVESNRNSENRNQELSYVSRRIKMLAMESGVPMIVLHQLNRASETENHRRPELRDLRDSGSIEQDADNVIFIHRPGNPRTNGDIPMDKREFIIAKQRNGEAGKVIPMRFIGPNIRFQEDFET